MNRCRWTGRWTGSRRPEEHGPPLEADTGRNAGVCGELHVLGAGRHSTTATSMRPCLSSEIVRRQPNCRRRRASGAFDNSPQFQLRVCGAPTQLVPTGRLRFVLAQAVGGLASDRFSRPGGADGVGRTPPAVETAGYCQCVPVGRKNEPPREQALFEKRGAGLSADLSPAINWHVRGNFS